MTGPALHIFERDGRRYAIDPESCFCFECDEVSWDVLAHYPRETANRIVHLLRGRHDPAVLREVISELDWLRATKAILKVPKSEELARRFEVEQGLCRLDVLLGPSPGVDVAERAAVLLLARSGARKDLTLVYGLPAHDADPASLSGAVERAARAARAAGKRLTVAVRLENLPLRGEAALDGHDVALQLEFGGEATDPRAALHAFARARLDRIKGLADTIQPGAPGVSGRVVLRPGHAEIAPAVERLDRAGFSVIELDMDHAYARGADPLEVGRGLHAAAVYYANQLLRHHYFRLEPVADIFLRIYHGEPALRTDPAGTGALALDGAGNIYPAAAWAGREEFRLGSLDDGVEEARLGLFEDAGALTTPGCMRCWARGLCGGGRVVVHEALGGNWRKPHPPWCGAQRTWLEGAVSAFNVLSAAGVNFTRVYGQLGAAKKPSLFALARAAFRMQIGLRPIEEADAALLTRWENWNEAAYFTCNERSMFLATEYDR
jgi:radical SAM protein with 4Fe4S-binding SPASM domain